MRKGSKFWLLSGVLVEKPFLEEGVVAIAFFNLRVVVVGGGC